MLQQLQLKVVCNIRQDRDSATRCSWLHALLWHPSVKLLAAEETPTRDDHVLQLDASVLPQQEHKTAGIGCVRSSNEPRSKPKCSLTACFD